MPILTTKTLFFEATKQAAILVTNQHGRRTQSALEFEDAHAALNWCLANRCTLVVIPGADPKSN